MPSVSFHHAGDESMASYRLRCALPAKALEATLNNPQADILVFSKPHQRDVEVARMAKHDGRNVVTDYCDAHYQRPEYRALVEMSDAIVCGTSSMEQAIRYYHTHVPAITVIEDPYSVPEVAPHCGGSSLLWYGHGSNLPTIQRVLPFLAKWKIRLVSNIHGCIPWSLSTMLEEYAKADIVVLPAGMPWKGANRTLDAIRQGCYVVAEPHRALRHIPGIWQGDLEEGVEWASTHWAEANGKTLAAQEWIRARYSPEATVSKWRTLVASLSASIPLPPSQPIVYAPASPPPAA